VSGGGLHLAPAAVTSAAAITINSSLGAVLVSVACALLVGVALVLLLRVRNDSAVRRVQVYVTHNDDKSDRRSLIERALGDKQARTIARLPVMTRLRLEMDVADIQFPLEQVMIATALVTILVGWLLASATGSPIAAALALLVPFLANFGIKMVADRRRREFSDQLPDNLQVIASAMRAGQTFVGAMRSVLEDAPEPSQRELRRAVMDEQLGVPLTEALGQVTERMKSEDFQHVAIVAALQRETGGNTAEVIDLVADTVRERIAIRRLVRGLTAQGRLSGGVLSFMPVGLLMVISVVNPKYMHPMFHSTTGLIALGVATALVIAGGMVIRKIIQINV
jgi:tight adherence protein B